MKQYLTGKQWDLRTWITVISAVILCLFVLGSTAHFLSHPFLSNKELEKAMGDSATLFLLILVGGGFTDIVVGWTLCIAAALVCAAAVLGAIIMVRAPEQPANRQVAGLLMAFASFLGLRFFVSILPIYQSFYKLAPAALNLTEVTLLVFLALSLARFLVIFPRAVDTDSVHQTYIRRPFLMRWSLRAHTIPSLACARGRAATGARWRFTIRIVQNH
jgi:hypothetical protein